MRAHVRRSAPDRLVAGDVKIDKLARRAWHGQDEQLGDDARAPTHVVTVRGVGLRFEGS